jgi:hypothetical protein
MRKSLIAGLIVLTMAFSAFSEEQKGTLEWSFTGEVTLAPSVLDGNPSVYDCINTAAYYNYGFFSLLADIALRNDKKYSPAEDYWLGRYFYVAQGGALFDFPLLSLQAGRFCQNDVIDSPYSLFISSTGLPARFTDFTFHTGRFTYKSRWIILNNRSIEQVNYPDGYPDRGMNYKIFAFRFGDLQVGLQDVVVYVDYSFDPEYFLSPVPHTFLQLHREEGKPWSQDTNDNIIMGLFAQWSKPNYYVYGQWLLDDINLDFLIPGFLRDTFGDVQIPQKTAWSVGGYYDFSFGRLGFYHAGATKYTFSPKTDWQQYPYQYTYYPGVRYQLKDGTQLPLDYKDNYIGYLYGENNLAFLLDFTRPFGPVEFNASLEYVVSGSKSPANPWHEYEKQGETGSKTRLLDDSVLEHTVAASVSASWSWKKLSLNTKLRLGGVFNKLELEPAGGTEVPPGLDIFRPQPGEHEFLYQLSVGVGYVFGGPDWADQKNPWRRE